MHNYATPFAHIILLGASPEVDAACVAGDVEHSQALQTRQGHGNAVTLRRRRKAQDVRGKTAERERFCFPTQETALRLSVWPPAELSAPGSCTSSGRALWSPALRTTSCSWCDCCRRRRGEENPSTVLLFHQSKTLMAKERYPSVRLRGRFTAVVAEMSWCSFVRE